MEAESGLISAFQEQDSEPMGSLQIFRSTVLVVMFALHLQKLLLVKKTQEKENAMRNSTDLLRVQDFEAVLQVYFDATRMWLGKVVRTPLLSLLQDPTVDVDISSKTGLAGSTLRGFAKKFGGLLARRPVPPNTLSGDQAADPAKLLKLKVRLKGILDALAKAIEKKEVPAGILDFWKRMSTDGVYFPPSVMLVDAPEQYQLFPEERQALEFDALGATRRMQSEVSISMDKGDSIGDAEPVPDDGKEVLSTRGTRKAFSRFDIVMLNFLCVRILIPHVILTPWDVGVGSVGMGKQAAANLSSLATVLYLVCRQLSPLPAPADPIEPPSRLRRLSKSAGSASSTTTDQVRHDSENPQSQNTADLGGEDAGRSSPEPGGGGSADANRFLSIEDIGRRLVLDRNFPCKDPPLIQLVQEHQVRGCVQSV
ncbi:hypothetical protein BBJ28_00010474 [Nothophytophthora sp. Chile5]|nr:hypothetical protein BBJ28_00010474 [Nothophytophthora sp. Chile5]